MKEAAYAKINLSLDVIGKRADGYHELSMIMLPLTYHDTLELMFSTVDEYTSDSGMTFDEQNTIVKAVKLMRQTYSLDYHFHVHCIKRIPMQAGLAGGSADAAAVMRTINKLCELNRPLEELAALGKQIGADVPFCVMNVPAYVHGIGEKIEPLNIRFDDEITLVKPHQGVSTKEAFQTLDFSTCEHPNIQAVLTALKQGNRQAMLQGLGNALEQPAFRLVPEIGVLKQAMQEIGFDAVLMSGSGSCLFGLSQDGELYEQLRRDELFKDCQCFKTSVLCADHQE